MSVIVILILASLLVALAFLAAFVWAVRTGQYDDTSTPSMRVLTEEAPVQADPRRPEDILHPSMSPPAPARARFSPHSQSESNRT